MEDANETYEYPDILGEPQRLELNLAFSLEHVTELILLCSLAVDKFGAFEKKN